MKNNLFFLLLLCFFSLSQYVQGDITDKYTELSFPSQVSFDHEGKNYQLDASGIATRKKFFVKVYSVVSYLQNGVVTNKDDAFAQILQDNKAKQLTIKFVYEASLAKVKEGYQETFEKVLSKEEYSKLKNEIDSFLGFFKSDAKVGDVYVIRWLPGGYIDLNVNGASSGNITNVEFAQALFSIWFGPNSIVKRDDLINLIK